MFEDKEPKDEVDGSDNSCEHVDKDPESICISLCRRFFRIGQGCAHGKAEHDAANRTEIDSEAEFIAVFNRDCLVEVDRARDNEASCR